jgi:hypothetical protein
MLMEARPQVGYARQNAPPVVAQCSHPKDISLRILLRADSAFLASACRVGDAPAMASHRL